MILRGQTARSGGTAVIATIVGTSGREIDEAMESAAREGADAAEVRLDAAPHVAPENLGTDSKIPLIASCRAKRDGGWFEGSEEERVQLLARAARTGRFQLDVELGSAAERLREENPSWLAVLSEHVTSGTPPDLSERALRLLAALGPGQIAKLVPTARVPSDVLAVRSVLKGLRDPRLAAFSMGEPGRASRILCGAWGSAAVWAAARPDAPGAAGQIDLHALLGLFRFRRVTAGTRVFGVAGSPVAGSLSPAIHNTAFAHLGLDAVYVPVECDSAEELASFARDLPLDGVSITVPLKIAILPFIDAPDRSVLEVGACNTMLDGRGFNTDGEAALEEIRSRLDPTGRPATVIGAGGAARAVAFALHRAGARLTIATRSSADALQDGGLRDLDPRGPDDVSGEGRSHACETDAQLRREEEADGQAGKRHERELAARAGESLAKLPGAPPRKRQDRGEGRAGESLARQPGAPPARGRHNVDGGAGEALARQLGARYCRIADLSPDEAGILVQATSAPLDDPVVPESALRAAFVLDLRYSGEAGSLPTALVAAARQAGIPASDGLGMLVRQAAAQVKLFTGREVPLEILLKAVGL